MTTNYKNTIKPVLLILLISSIGMGCKKLDQQPQATANKAAVFGSQAGLELYTTSFYNILPTTSAVIRGDEMCDYFARTAVPDFIRAGAYGPQNSSGWSWGDLRNINYFIVNCNDPAVPKAVRENYIGIARFFRGWFYFEKIKRFGDVPWINKPFDVDDPGLYAARDSRTLVIDSVMADLDYAAAHITTSDNTRSLITKNTALAFKSRVGLFEGTYRKYHTELNQQSSANTLLTAAATAAQQVMTSGGFSLNTAGGTDKAYRNLFNNQAVVPSETILADIVDPALSILNDANWYYTSGTYGARLSFIRTFINTYLNIDGTPFTNKAGYQTMTFPQEVKNRDMRLQQTIRMGNLTRVNGGVQQPAPPVFSYTYTGYMPIKFTIDDASMDGGARNTNSLVLMRYAEVLLNYAEAKAELGTLTDADWNSTIGALRRRAGITGATTTVKPTVADPYLQANYFPGISDPVILEVRRERGIELAMEGFRFSDLARWKRGKLMEQIWNGFYVPALNTPMDLNEDGVQDVLFYQVKPATTISGVTYVNVAATVSGAPNAQRLANDTFGELTWLTTVPRVWDDKYYLYPIPQADLQVNPKLGQNPGW
ncbi:RagB/SusD family nutrient uptake outer membrane protein [Mucilaginibacter boryungensis]|uniref:RagB/SusD family nutrient uptake outer membrane protein n=1 Tax=Mucilaginibacter boryungensis TaxID=768480 RepID=A0ABR9XH98_9SPHI|nr:RagB/SusD family nutrient uptake outer membrane protein [Mucilaginibacter boryungensis]MBE9666764.1 RagB/SusD family nutrient uptake outer membrane protein [Mucilaginibacter boryungensis]